MKKAWAPAGAAIILALLATPVSAAPRPVSPTDGARVKSSLPVFRWVLPLGEVAAEISIARLPRTGPDGAFPAENVVAADFLDPVAERWRPSRPLFAGTYWWRVSSTPDPATGLDVEYSPVSEFTIPISLDVLRISGPVRRVVTVRWRGNVRRVSINLRMSSRGSVVWSAVQAASTAAPTRAVSTRFTVPARYTGLLSGASFTVGISARVAPGR